MGKLKQPKREGDCKNHGRNGLKVLRTDSGMWHICFVFKIVNQSTRNNVTKSKSNRFFNETQLTLSKMIFQPNHCT
jgi:hypothetical protein